MIAVENTKHYPKPGQEGGRLIREVVRVLKSQNLSLPLSSHILIAISGGSDSVALAHLLVHFGRRVALKTQISLLHVNHGWRGQESDQDEVFVKNLGERWGVPVILRRLEPKPQTPGESWEEEARIARKAIFEEEAQKHQAQVITAHQADDLAETLLWRIFTGAAQTHGGGIAIQHGIELRPFLRVRKSAIKKYLEEVSETYREDSTNFSDRFLRARMRNFLMPEMEKIFPKAVEHLVEMSFAAQSRRDQQTRRNLDETLRPPYEILFDAVGLKARRPHLEFIEKKWVAKENRCGEVHLPGGWRLICEDQKALQKKESISDLQHHKNNRPPLERWILERI